MKAKAPKSANELIQRIREEMLEKLRSNPHSFIRDLADDDLLFFLGIPVFAVSVP